MKRPHVNKPQILYYLDHFTQIAFLFTIFGLMLSKPAPILIGAYSVIASWFMSRIFRKLPFLPNTGVNGPMIFVFVTLILSIFAGGDWAEGWRGLNKWIRAFLIFFASYDFFQDKSREGRAIAAFTLVFLIACFDGFYQYFSGFDLFFRHPLGAIDSRFSRITSSFGYFGMFACFLMMVLPVTLIWASRQKTRGKKLAVTSFLILIGLISLYLTRTRGAWITTAVMIFIYMAAMRKKWMLFLLAGITVLSIFILPRDLIFHHRMDGSGFDKSANHRIVLWKQAANIIKANPIAGCGLNTYVKNISKYNEEDYYDASNYYAHNGYLQHTAETGFLGLAAVLLFLFRYFTILMPNCFAKRPFSLHQSMILLSIIGFLFYMIFDTIFHNLQPFIMFWIFLGWGLAIQKRSIEQ